MSYVQVPMKTSMTDSTVVQTCSSDLYSFSLINKKSGIPGAGKV